LQIATAGEDSVITLEFDERQSPEPRLNSTTPISPKRIAINHRWLTSIDSGSADGGWKALLYLTIDTSSGNPQKLDANQEVLLYENGSDDPVVISWQDGYSIETNVPINILGGNDINVSYMDSDNNVRYVDFYRYVDNSSNLPTEFTYDAESGKLTLNVQVAAQSQEDYTISDVGMPSGSYIIQVMNNTENISVTLSYGGSTAEPYNGTGKLNTYYHIVSSVSDASLTLAVENTSNTTISTKIDIYPPFKYSIKPFLVRKTNDSGADDIEGESILDVVERLDMLNFDYTYVVNDDILIENPLIASSFFDVDHIYNKFTIAQANTITLNVTNVTTK